MFEDRKLAERQYRDPQSRGGEVLPGFYAHLDLIEARGGDLAAAAAVLREGLARFPDNAYLRQRQVGVLCALGSPGAALEPALQLLGITPIGPGALRNVELMLRKLNAGEQGYFERGLDTLKPATLGRIGEACFSEQCFTLGSCAWASLLRRRPGELDYRLHRAVALLGTAQRAAGLQALAEAREAQLAEGLVNRTTIVQRIIRRLGAQRYLEIGVERATNFLQIDAPQRVAVDPAFAVPGGVEGIAATRWFAVPSDEFFEQHARTALADGVEVVFIDGLHSYAQVLRDIDNALTHLAPGGVIALHDCLPKNAAEACANEADARRHLEFGNAWTGDVYRAIVHLRANRADLEVFVLDTDHGVGIVRRGAPLSTVEIDIERIAALDFAEFAARREYWLELRPVSFLDEWLERLGVPG
ncbi:MAG: class I SAM-dependent methyltransferase [Gammaproteobacteria bacterium]|nr:class I SAM-dependent methyltransferase [Gammaproteobacteria bacterium]